VTLDLLVSTARIAYEEGHAYLSIHHEMTERLKNIHELGEANNALLMRNRELRDFTTTASTYILQAGEGQGPRVPWSRTYKQTRSIFLMK
jgi:hypothetical protein